MTTPYAVASHIGSVSYNSYVNAPITGPLNTKQTPGHIPYHSYGILSGTRPTPPQFYPGQEPVYADMNSNMRKQYLRTAISKTVKAQQLALGKMSIPQSYVINSSQRQVPVSSHTNYIAPLESSMYVNIVKSNAVGQSVYTQTMAKGTKSYYPSGTRQSIRRVRSGGCVAPKKKSAIENTTFTRSSNWGGNHY